MTGKVSAITMGQNRINQVAVPQCPINLHLVKVCSIMGTALPEVLHHHL